MFEHFLIKALLSIFLISLIVLISVIWTKIEKTLDNTVFKNISKKTKYIITMILVMVGEFVLIVITSFNWRASIIDTLFFGSIILFCCIWLIPYFVNQQQNVAKVMDKHFSGGVDLGEIQVHRAKLSAFNLGSIVFSIVGIFIPICYYFKYFL
ncbi:hypothetical protein P5815_22465 [Bacillus cereus]|uniref:hypothetical protein n=1 Tax=Bacillus TaxID=1386 RepID=UPI000BF7128A|nr:hypothetical protein [Bacillus cereus]MBJ7954753.1 hypothetical protein [Bacillus cereus]MBT0792653.1 hypothetical protein [Bacillus cereus]MBX9158814.1 hypothetical protein [Bacillus cereus]MCC3689133.1 hypothetical protein [Bacillus cereus]MCU5042529.1 hypothetical protein [Bacillus cereus]